MKIGTYFWLSEFTRSTAAEALGLDNEPVGLATSYLMMLVQQVLDPLRQSMGVPVRVTSGYRSPEVNKAVGGSKTSSHMYGQAADIKADGWTAEEIATRVLSLGLPFDQVIWYAPQRGGHVHVSHRPGRNRREVLYAPSHGGYQAATPNAPR